MHVACSGELYPTSVRTTAHGISAGTAKCGALWAVVWFNYLGKRTQFWTTASFNFGGMMLTALFMPDPVCGTFCMLHACAQRAPTTLMRHRRLAHYFPCLACMEQWVNSSRGASPLCETVCTFVGITDAHQPDGAGPSLGPHPDGQALPRRGRRAAQHILVRAHDRHLQGVHLLLI